MGEASMSQSLTQSRRSVAWVPHQGQEASGESTCWAAEHGPGMWVHVGGGWRIVWQPSRSSAAACSGWRQVAPRACPATYPTALSRWPLDSGPRHLEDGLSPRPAPGDQGEARRGPLAVRAQAPEPCGKARGRAVWHPSLEE